MSKDTINYWNNRYANGRNSGAGSYGEFLNRKLNWLKNLDIKSIVDVGCGDFNFGKHLTEMYPNVSYLGLDSSDFIIHKNSLLYPEHKFQVVDDIPQADLVLCIDVLLHVLDEKEVEDLLNKLEKSWVKYLAITAYERNEEMGNHVRIRKFDYKRFGEPIIREICEEDGEHYFYLWKK